MTPTTRVVGLLAVVVATVTALTGCNPGPGNPVATSRTAGATAAPTSTVTTNPVAPSVIVVSAHSVSVSAADDSHLIDIPYTTTIAMAASRFSATIGVEPTVTPVAATSCSPATARYDWGGIQFYTDAPFSDSLGAAYLVSVTAPRTRNGLTVETAGQTVGASLTDVLAQVPGSASGDRGEGHIEAVVDPQEGGDWGVILHIQSGRVTDFIAPGLFLFGHGTC